MNLEYFIVPAASYLIGSIPFGYLIGGCTASISARSAAATSEQPTSRVRSAKSREKSAFSSTSSRERFRSSSSTWPSRKTRRIWPSRRALRSFSGTCSRSICASGAARGMATAAASAGPRAVSIALRACGLGRDLPDQPLRVAGQHRRPPRRCRSSRRSSSGSGSAPPSRWPIRRYSFSPSSRFSRSLRHISNIKRLLNGTENRFDSGAGKRGSGK